MNYLEHKITFLLADDHSLIRQGIIFILEETDIEFEVLHASNLQQIIESFQKNQIDVAIIDAHFPDGNSLNILPEIKKISPKTKILIFTGLDENTHSLKFINAGANGFLSKISDADETRQAILKILQNEKYISATTQSLLINSIQNPKLVNPLLLLTEREIQIAQLYSKGYGNLEIANQLDIKQNTVSTLKKRIFEKLNIENIVELIELIKNNN